MEDEEEESNISSKKIEKGPKRKLSPRKEDGNPEKKNQRHPDRSARMTLKNSKECGVFFPWHFLEANRKQKNGLCTNYV